MAEYIIDLSGVVTKSLSELSDSERLSWLCGIPIGEEIVRCRDCRHFTPNKEHWLEPPEVPFPIIGATCDTCDFWAGGCKVEPDGFCAWGERRDA